MEGQCEEERAGKRVSKAMQTEGWWPAAGLAKGPINRHLSSLQLEDKRYSHLDKQRAVCKVSSQVLWLWSQYNLALPNKEPYFFSFHCIPGALAPPLAPDVQFLVLPGISHQKPEAPAQSYLAYSMQV